MTGIFAPEALLPDGWAERVRVTLADGRIAGVTPGAAPEPGDTVLTGMALLPAASNVHSHAFQRAMAGLAEMRATGEDDFWTWRSVMYDFLGRMTPESVEAVAAQLCVEMLEAGFACLGEFHYLHHQKDGTPYDNPAEMAERIAAAASATGMGLTLLPVLYAQGGCDGRALAGGQVRFGNGLSGFAKIMDGAARAVDALPADARLGIAPHSLRAVPPAMLAEATAMWSDGPIHIHAAEQVKEVAEVEAHLGARPVRWLLDTAGADARWCLIHATQMEPGETEGLAASGAVAGLCPITESNLGDGIFDGARFIAAGGAFGVGSDSDVRISVSEELRTFEYSQRLRDRRRAILAPPGGSVGETIYLGAVRGGAQAMGRESGAIEAGKWADLVAVDRTGPVMAPLPAERVLDGWIFAGGNETVREVWSAGRHMVRGGRHVKRDEVAEAYRQAMRAVSG